jgi:hypothetical protein
MTKRPLTGLRRAAIALALAALVAAILVPTGPATAKRKRKPIIYGAVATYLDHSGVLELSVRVHKANDVKVTFGGQTRQASPAANVHDWWQASFAGGPKQTCYFGVRVRAKNGHGSKKKTRNAGTLGTGGCNPSKSPRR